MNVSPEVVTAAAGSLENIGSAMSAANSAAAAPTTRLVAMAADQVSAAVTAALTSYAQQYQALGLQAAAFHAQFARAVSSGALAYLSSEIANAEQVLINAVNAPAVALLGHAVIPTGPVGGHGGGTVSAGIPATTTSGTVGTTTAGSGTSATSGSTGTATSGTTTATSGSTGTTVSGTTTATAGGTTVSTGTAATDVTTASSGAVVSTGTALTGVTATSGGSTVVTAGTSGATDATTVGTAVGADPGTTVTVTPVAPAPVVEPVTPAPVIDPVTGVPISGATGGSATLLDSAPATIPLINANTPFGPLSLTLSGMEDLFTGQITIDSGSIALPAPLALSFDALGPYYLAMNSLHHSGTAFVSAMQHGNVLGAVNALFFAPTNAMGGFFFGHDTISQTVPAPGGFGYTSVGFQVPVGGLFSPLQPLTLILTPTGSAPTNIALGGTEVGGLLPGLLSLFH
ncbi:PE family protein [Mycobacterium angelicum]|nr:PE family protein [Mycobacterium angelicum]